jgi:hypothetical protein
LPCRFQSKSRRNEGHSICYGNAQGKNLGTEKPPRRDCELCCWAFREPSTSRVGLGSASHGEPLSTPEIERLKALELAHLRVDSGFVSARVSGAFATGSS